jgi:hypothetical protein
MIGQYLPNNNETATVAFRQKFCQLNSPLALAEANSSHHQVSLSGPIQFSSFWYGMVWFGLIWFVC